MEWNDDRWAQLAGLTDEGGSNLLSEGVTTEGEATEGETPMHEQDPDAPTATTTGDTTMKGVKITQGTFAKDEGHKRLKKESRRVSRQQRLMENKLRKLIREEIKSYMKAKNRSNNVQRSLNDLKDLDLHRGTTGYASGQVHSSNPNHHAYYPRQQAPTMGFLGPGFKKL